MLKRKIGFFCLVLFLSLMMLAGCDGNGDSPAADEATDTGEETGTLLLTANGEEFIREGFVSKDGWEMSFSKAYVTVSSIEVYQTDNPPYDTNMGWDIDGMVLEKVSAAGPYTLNLADPGADPAAVDELSAVPAGRYNAIYWELVQAPDGPAEGYAIYLAGTAQKDGEIVEFSLGIDKEVALLGGDYVGDDRKGILAAGGSADIEMTFHFDHLFGDAEEDIDDELNLEALGFEPLAALAVNGKLAASLSDLKGMLSNDDYELLLDVMTHLAHVGEGHCLAKFIE